jgi:hypothetical protein
MEFDGGFLDFTLAVTWKYAKQNGPTRQEDDIKTH